MSPTNAHLLSVLRGSREDIVKQSTDIAFASAEVPFERSGLEQLLRASIAVVEERLAGDATNVRREVLDTLHDLAHTWTWDATLRASLPCWGVLLGQLVSGAGRGDQAEAIRLLSRFLSAWLADVSKKMLPVPVVEGAASGCVATDA